MRVAHGLLIRGGARPISGSPNTAACRTRRVSGISDGVDLHHHYRRASMAAGALQIGAGIYAVLDQSLKLLPSGPPIAGMSIRPTLPR